MTNSWRLRWLPRVNWPCAAWALVWCELQNPRDVHAKIKQTWPLCFAIFPPKNFINLLLKLIVQKVSVGQTLMRGDNVKFHRLQVTIDLHKSKLYVKTKQKFFKDINSFALKVDKCKIVQLNGEWKLYKENKEISTLTLKEAMLLFLAFGSRSVERSERSSQVPNNHWRMSSPAALLGASFLLHFIWLKILKVALRQDYSNCNFFFVLPTRPHCLKNSSEVVNLNPDRRNLSIDESTSLYFFLSKSSLTRKVH